MIKWLFSACNSAIKIDSYLYKITSSQMLCSDLELVLKYLEFHSG